MSETAYVLIGVILGEALIIEVLLFGLGAKMTYSQINPTKVGGFKRWKLKEDGQCPTKELSQ